MPPPRWRWRSFVFGNRAPLGIFTHNPIELKFGCWMHLSPHQCSNSKRPASITFLCALSYQPERALTQRAFNQARLSSKDGRRSKTRQAASSLQPAGFRLDHGHRRHLASLMLDGRHFRYRCQANGGGRGLHLKESFYCCPLLAWRTGAANWFGSTENRSGFRFCKGASLNERTLPSARARGRHRALQWLTHRSGKG